MRIAILGYGEQGRSAYEYWSRDGNEVVIHDQLNLTNLPEGALSDLGGDYLLDLNEYDLIIRSPSVHPREILRANPEHPEVMNKITTVTNEFFKVCPSKNIIGVTGTKGKGTTSTLIAKLLEEAGHKVHLGGNIGIPPLDMLKNNIAPEDWVVLELANFQLIDLQYSPPVAVCLMVAPEHLNWHTDMFEYIRAKQQLFTHQIQNNRTVYNARNAFSEEVVGASHAQKIAYDVPPEDSEPVETREVYVDGHKIMAFGHHIANISDVALLGRHNLENVCAAIAATWDIIEGKKSIIKKVLKSFTGLPHRIEIVKRVNDVWYVDDSFGTTPETAIVALKAFEKPKILIVGGSDKGADFMELGQAITNSNVKHVVAIGQTGPVIVAAIKRFDPQGRIGITEFGTNVTMPEIVAAATRRAIKGDVVLLSTGCASFGMFANYKDRGEQFKAAVQSLAEAAK